MSRFSRRWAVFVVALFFVLTPSWSAGQAREVDTSAVAVRLEDVLAKAVHQHPLLEAARARVAAARGVRRAVGALPNPIFTYSVENTAFPGRTLRTPLDRETQTYATLPLEPLFQRWSRVRGADEQLRAADADLVRARQMVAFDAARAFYRVAEAQVAVDAAAEVQRSLRELQTYNAARVREGVTAEADLIRTQVELARVDAASTLARVDLARARADLAPYLGDAGGSRAALSAIRVVVSGPAAGDATVDSLRSLPVLLAAARAGRPDVSAARARVAAARAEVRLQRTLAVRQLGATLGSKRSAGVTSMIAGVSVPIPLFDRNRGEIERASADRVVAEQELAWTERRASAEVEAAYESAQLLAVQADQLRGTFLERAQESRRIALAAYQDGAISLLQVLDAARTLADARLTFYRTLVAQRESALELRIAVGEDPFAFILLPTAEPSPASGRLQPIGEQRP